MCTIFVNESVTVLAPTRPTAVSTMILELSKAGIPDKQRHISETNLIMSTVDYQWNVEYTDPKSQR